MKPLLARVVLLLYSAALLAAVWWLAGLQKLQVGFTASVPAQTSSWSGHVSGLVGVYNFQVKGQYAGAGGLNFDISPRAPERHLVLKRLTRFGGDTAIETRIAGDRIRVWDYADSAVAEFGFVTWRADSSLLSMNAVATSASLNSAEGSLDLDIWLDTLAADALTECWLVTDGSTAVEAVFSAVESHDWRIEPRPQAREVIELPFGMRADCTRSDIAFRKARVKPFVSGGWVQIDLSMRQLASILFT